MNIAKLPLAMWALFATPPTSAFVVPFPAPSLATARTIPRNERVPVTAQLAVTIDAPNRPALQGNKRIVRRKKAKPPALAVLDIKNAPVKVNSLLGVLTSPA